MKCYWEVALVAMFVTLGPLFAQAPPLPFAIQLKASAAVSSADATVGQIVLFTNLKAFAQAGNDFAAGAIAAGRVVESKPGSRMAQGGVLKISIEDIQLEDGRTFPLTGVAVFHGGAHYAGMAGGAVLAGLIVTPYVAPAALLLHGKAAIMPEGALVVATFGAAAPSKPVPGTTSAKTESKSAIEPQSRPH